jgi:hypothetical protein
MRRDKAPACRKEAQTIWVSIRTDKTIANPKKSTLFIKTSLIGFLFILIA